MPNKFYTELIVKTSPFDMEELSGLLWELNPIGLEEGELFIKLFFQEADAVTKTTRFLDELQERNLIDSYTLEEAVLENRNWNEEWERSLNIIKVTDKITIRPSFKEYNAVPGEIVLVIDPKMSFGTGEHQTTKLVLRTLEKYVNPGIRLIDVGTGTGVLAIAAVKLGAQYALAIDNDDWCYDNGLENCAMNDVSRQQVEIRTADIYGVSESEFDLTLANIQKNVLLEICDALIAKTRLGGTIILSGLLHQDETDIVNKFTSAGVSFLDKDALDEWICLVFKK
ncbi:MAG: 50S ribosomal protein L11 methyltransferase [Ignavibacteria bacterium]|nr:50S ribosomal protein L11 methyltransferase [Ignavibacteria bacterium]